MAKDSPTSTLRLPPKPNPSPPQSSRHPVNGTKAQNPTQSSPQQYLSPYGSSLDVSSTSRPNPVSPSVQPSSTGANPTIAKMVSEVIARASVNAVNATKTVKPSSEWEAARKAAEAALQSAINSNTILISTSPATETPDQARTGGRRGRGPRRRGSPRSEITETTNFETENNSEIETPSRGRPIGRPRGSGRGGRPRGSRGRGGRGGRPRGSRGARGIFGSLRGGKRKRNDDDDGDDTDDSDASEILTLLPTQSRSGRKIFQTQQIMPIIKISDTDVTLLESSPASKLTTNKLTPNQTTPNKRPTKKVRRTPGTGAVCTNCNRGHSPPSNAIVFCDDCNTPWHQYCHNPPIAAEAIQIEEKEWFCTDCTVLREEKERLAGRVAGEHMSLAEKRHYLQALPQPDLVSLLLHACALHPTLPIFAPKNSSTTPPPGGAEEYYDEEDALPYPKAGNGIILPPESEDMAYLLDEDVEVFSHSWIGRPGLPQGAESFLAMGPGAVSVGA